MARLDESAPADPQIAAAARALAAGDPLAALNRVALRDDAPALALRGSAMAQLGQFDRARTLVRRAVRAFGHDQAVARARCVVAEAEIALASRHLDWAGTALDSARSTLAAHGDRPNAAHAGLLKARRLLLIGHLDEAERALDALASMPLPAAARAIHALAIAGIAMRRVRARAARAALIRAAEMAQQAGIPALAAEVADASRVLDTPAARLLAEGAERPVLLHEIEDLLASETLVVDACRYVVRDARSIVHLAGRPVLLTLVRALAAAWPDDVARETLAARVFRAKSIDASHRARLRVEIGRLRAELRGVAAVRATRRGFMLMPCAAREVAVLAWPVERRHAAVLALLADGESWSSSALAIALGVGQRTVQRALEALAGDGEVQSFGRGRARRWAAPVVPGFTTTLLLPAPLP